MDDVKEGDLALFVAFSGDGEEAVLGDVTYVEAEGFVDAQAAAIEECHERAVAGFDPILGGEKAGIVEDFEGLALFEGAREFVVFFRGTDDFDGGVVHDALFVHPVEQVFEAGEGARATGVGGSAHGFAREPGAEVCDAGLGKVVDGDRFADMVVEKCDELCDVGGVGADCVFGEVLFIAQMVVPFLEGVGEVVGAEGEGSGFNHDFNRRGHGVLRGVRGGFGWEGFLFFIMSNPSLFVLLLVFCFLFCSVLFYFRGWFWGVDLLSFLRVV